MIKPYSIEELKLRIKIFLNRSSKTIAKQITEYEFEEFVFEPLNFCIKSPKETVKLTEREV